MKTYQVGDQIVIRNGSQSGEPFKILKIVKVTKTQVEVENGVKFMLKSGKKIGGYGGWFEDSLDTYDMSITDAFKQNKEWHKENDIKILCREISNYSWRNVPYEKLARIKKILDE